jgi:hypothetical protein
VSIALSLTFPSLYPPRTLRWLAVPTNQEIHRTRAKNIGMTLSSGESSSWTHIHLNIHGNDRAGTLAKRGSSSDGHKCEGAYTSQAWLY